MIAWLVVVWPGAVCLERWDRIVTYRMSPLLKPKFESAHDHACVIAPEWPAARVGDLEKGGREARVVSFPFVRRARLIITSSVSSHVRIFPPLHPPHHPHTMSGLKRVYVGKLPQDVRQDDIEAVRLPLPPSCSTTNPIIIPPSPQLFRDFKIRECRLMAGFGFVEFEDARDAEDAVQKFDGAKLLGEPIMVEFAKERRPREGMDPRGGAGYGPPGGAGGGFGGPRRAGVKVLLKGVGSDVSWQVRRGPLGVWFRANYSRRTSRTLVVKPADRCEQTLTVPLVTGKPCHRIIIPQPPRLTLGTVSSSLVRRKRLSRPSRSSARWRFEVDDRNVPLIL